MLNFEKIKAVWEYYDGQSGGEGVEIEFLQTALEEAGASNLTDQYFDQQITSDGEYEVNTTYNNFVKMMETIYNADPNNYGDKLYNPVPTNQQPLNYTNQDIKYPSQDLMTPQHMPNDYGLIGSHLDVNAHANEITGQIQGNRDQHWNQIQSIISKAYRGNDYANQFKTHHDKMSQVIHSLENTVGALQNDYLRSMARNKELTEAGRLQNNYNIELSNALNEQRARLQQREYLEARLAQLKIQSQSAGMVQVTEQVREDATGLQETGRQIQDQYVQPQYRSQYIVPQKEYIVPQKEYVKPVQTGIQYLGDQQDLGMRRSRSFGNINYRTLGTSNLDNLRFSYLDNQRGSTLSTGNKYLDDVQQDQVLPGKYY